MYDAMVEVAGGRGRAVVAVITAASGKARENGDYYVELFQR